MDRIMLAGTSSGCGKTTVTLALLSALREREIRLCSFKCGPDYIDPIFHRELLGVRTRNLDPFFCDSEQLRRSLAENADSDLALIEGVMGYYDGIAATSRASSYEVSKLTETPVILVLRPDGMCTSAAAIMRGFKSYKKDSRIVGVIFSCLNEKLYPYMKQLAEDSGLRPLGFLPKREELIIPSRQLGLVSDFSKADMKRKLELLGELAEKYIDLAAVLELAHSAVSLSGGDVPVPIPQSGIKIAVARDEAFCFIYEENLDALRNQGCELLFFSPLAGSALPDDASALYLPGGYPEIYARRLSENTSMLASIKRAVEGGLPTIAECGGFMYLHRRLDDYPMANVIPARAYKTDSLKRFGYITLRSSRDSLIAKAGESIPCHEFHYYDSTDCGEDFTAEKAGSKTVYPCANGSSTLYAGFPHLYFPARPQLAARFAQSAAQYKASHNER